MKTKLLVLILIALSSVKAQQFNGPNNTSGAIYRSGNTGFGMSSSPGYVADVEISAAGNGLHVFSSAGNPEPLIILENLNTGGAFWTFTALDNGSTPAGPHFMIQNAAANNCFFINGSSTNVGIGTSAPTEKLHVVEVSASGNSAAGLYDFSTSAAGTFAGISANCQNVGSVTGQINIGVDGFASCDGSPSNAIGIRGTAVGSLSGDNCFGGYFEGQGATSTFNVGAYGILTGVGAANNAAVYGDANGFTSIGNNAYAGYFNGDVFRTGSDNFTSDRNLKKNIKPLENVLANLRELKPCSYNFKNEEFKGLNLPLGVQMGLIAQDLELVYPELVRDMKGWSRQDKNGATNEVPDFKSVQYISLIPVLIAGIQELDRIVARQKGDLNTQAKLIESLMSMVAITGLQKEGAASATDMALSQNIPNPFSHETVISFRTPENSAENTIVVYDLSGKQITKYKIASGTSSLKLNSADLHPEIYIYSLVSDGKMLDSKRMIIADK